MIRYFCTHDALRMIAGAEQVPALRLGEYGVFAAETSEGARGGGRLRNLRRNLAHTVGVNVFFARLTRDARRAGHDVPEWWSEAEATQRFRDNSDRTYWVRPDGAGLYYLPGRQVPFMLEYDRGTMRRRDYLRKLVGIASYFEGKHYRALFGTEPTVLIVAEHDVAEERFRAVVQDASRRWDVAIPVLFTSRWRFERNPRNPNGTLGPIWQTLDSADRVRWIGDLGSVEQ